MPPSCRHLRRVGLLGDIHQEDEALAAALAWFESTGVDRVLAVGDIVDGAGDLARTCELLRSAEVEAVRGNHERWLLGGTMRDLPGALAVSKLSEPERAYLASLPATRSYESAAGAVLLCHGLGEEDMAAVKPDDFGYALENNSALTRLFLDGRHRIVLNGHTHRRMVRRLGTLTIVNAGTLCRDDGPCVAVADFVAGDVTYRELVGYELGRVERVALG